MSLASVVWHKSAQDQLLGDQGLNPKFETVLAHLCGLGAEVLIITRRVVLAAVGNIWWRLHRHLQHYPLKLFALAEPGTSEQRVKEALQRDLYV